MYSTMRMFITSLVAGILFLAGMALLAAFGPHTPAVVAATAAGEKPSAPHTSITTAIVTTPAQLAVAVVGSNPGLQAGGVAFYTLYITNTSSSADALGASVIITPFHGIVLEPAPIPFALPVIVAHETSSRSLRVRADIAGTLTVTVTVQSAGGNSVTDKRSETVSQSKLFIPLALASDPYQAGVYLG